MSAVILTYIVSRLVEPSTWAGIGLVVNAVVNKDWAHLPQAAMGVLATIIPENGTSAKMSPETPPK
jgi:hypothetical protein